MKYVILVIAILAVVWAIYNLVKFFIDLSHGKSYCDCSSCSNKCDAYIKKNGDSK